MYVVYEDDEDVRCLGTWGGESKLWVYSKAAVEAPFLVSWVEPWGQVRSNPCPSKQGGAYQPQIYQTCRAEGDGRMACDVIGCALLIDSARQDTRLGIVLEFVNMCQCRDGTWKGKLRINMIGRGTIHVHTSITVEIGTVCKCFQHSTRTNHICLS